MTPRTEFEENAYIHIYVHTVSVMLSLFGISTLFFILLLIPKGLSMTSMYVYKHFQQIYFPHESDVSATK